MVRIHLLPQIFERIRAVIFQNDKRFLKFILKEDKADEEGEREFASVNDRQATEVQHSNLSKETKKAEVAQLVEH